eukprot:Hpha_TRINITY_DN23865_c0_g1::TRINITY_DN23865_c0_g1_i1::g.109832::m.109832
MEIRPLTDFRMEGVEERRQTLAIGDMDLSISHTPLVRGLPVGGSQTERRPTLVISDPLDTSSRTTSAARNLRAGGADRRVSIDMRADTAVSTPASSRGFRMGGTGVAERRVSIATDVSTPATQGLVRPEERRLTGDSLASGTRALRLPEEEKERRRTLRLSIYPPPPLTAFGDGGSSLPVSPMDSSVPHTPYSSSSPPPKSSVQGRAGSPTAKLSVATRMLSPFGKWKVQHIPLSEVEWNGDPLGDAIAIFKDMHEVEARATEACFRHNCETPVMWCRPTLPPHPPPATNAPKSRQRSAGGAAPLVTIDASTARRQSHRDQETWFAGKARNKATLAPSALGTGRKSHRSSAATSRRPSTEQSEDYFQPS